MLPSVNCFIPYGSPKSAVSTLYKTLRFVEELIKVPVLSTTLIGPDPACVGTLTLICVADHDTIKELECNTSVNCVPAEKSACENSTAASPDRVPKPVPVMVKTLFVGSSNAPAVTVAGEKDEIT